MSEEKITESSITDNTKSRKKSLFNFKDPKVLFPFLIVVIGLATYFGTRNYRIEQAENEKVKIGVQMGIQPIIDNPESIPTRYNSWYMFTNDGIANSNDVLITWMINNGVVASSSKPYLMGTDHGMDIKIIESELNGFCEIKVDNILTNTGFFYWC